jgi:hypothetical protein
LIKLDSAKEIREFEFGFPSPGFAFPSSGFGIPFPRIWISFLRIWKSVIALAHRPFAEAFDQYRYRRS